MNQSLSLWRWPRGENGKGAGDEAVMFHIVDTTCLLLMIAFPQNTFGRIIMTRFLHLWHRHRAEIKKRAYDEAVVSPALNTTSLFLMFAVMAAINPQLGMFPPLGFNAMGTTSHLNPGRFPPAGVASHLLS